MLESGLTSLLLITPHNMRTKRQMMDRVMYPDSNILGKEYTFHSYVIQRSRRHLPFLEDLLNIGMLDHLTIKSKTKKYPNRYRHVLDKSYGHLRKLTIETAHVSESLIKSISRIFPRLEELTFLNCIFSVAKVRYFITLDDLCLPFLKTFKIYESDHNQFHITNYYKCEHDKVNQLWGFTIQNKRNIDTLKELLWSSYPENWVCPIKKLKIDCKNDKVCSFQGMFPVSVYMDELIIESVEFDYQLLRSISKVFPYLKKLAYVNCTFSKFLGTFNPMEFEDLSLPFLNEIIMCNEMTCPPGYKEWKSLKYQDGCVKKEVSRPWPNPNLSSSSSLVYFPNGYSYYSFPNEPEYYSISFDSSDLEDDIYSTSSSSDELELPDESNF